MFPIPNINGKKRITYVLEVVAYAITMLTEIKSMKTVTGLNPDIMTTILHVFFGSRFKKTNNWFR